MTDVKVGRPICYKLNELSRQSRSSRDEEQCVKCRTFCVCVCVCVSILRDVL